MIAHHPNDELLLSTAAGTLHAGAAIVVGAHLECCPHCRANVRTYESVGGALLEASAPALLTPEALARTLQMITKAPVASPKRTVDMSRPDLPSGVTWPQSLAHCTVSRWHWMGPGMRLSRVVVLHARDANVFLLRIGAGKALPEHTHTGVELTQVMCGSFHDGRALFAACDFDVADDSVHHQPMLQADGECICLASVTGRLMFKSAVARTIGSLVRI